MAEKEQPAGQPENTNHDEMIVEHAKGTQLPIHGEGAVKSSPIETRGQREEVEEARDQISKMPDAPAFTEGVSYKSDPVVDANRDTDILVEDSQERAYSGREKQDRRIGKTNSKIKMAGAVVLSGIVGFLGFLGLAKNEEYNEKKDKEQAPIAKAINDRVIENKVQDEAGKTKDQYVSGDQTFEVDNKPKQ